MGASLDGPRLKLDRAWKHIGDYGELHEPFVDAQADKITIEHGADSDGTPMRFWVIDEPEEPPPELGPLISDALHNLRSALDHMASQLILANGRHPSNRTGFPIHNDIATYVNDGLPQIARMSKGVQTVIESTQPYHGPHLDWKTHPLSLLNSWNNIYKHREFKLVVLSVELASGFGIPEGFRPAFNPIEGRTILAFWPNPEPDVEVNWAPRLEVIIADALWGDRRIGNQLTILWGRVQELVNHLAEVAEIPGAIPYPEDWPLPR